ncbi:DUF6064 family protein [Bradyrhizobium japonicum]|uniref:DUF6064 family protein n=1 Tax=Bradyrhizobium japonicum TaxID=375 RepID=UPI0004B529A4|nr:DUF6064 family protein [Bradyrhizobium japonicum]
MLPFSVEQFFGVFASYNRAIWPAQIVALMIGGLAFALVFRRCKRSDEIIAGVLAAMWAWTGLIYHLIFFAPINKMDYAFGALFAVQAMAFGYVGVIQGRMTFGRSNGPAAWIGIAFVLYAAAIYWLLGVAVGHDLAELPAFGVTPCPVTIFTFGMLLLTIRPIPRLLLIIPILWSLIGGSAAILLRVPQDWVLLVSGIVSAALLAGGDQRLASASSR